MRTLSIQIMLILSLGLMLDAFFPLSAQAQSVGFSLPATSSAGAVLNYELWQFNMRRQQPFFFRPITPEDAVGVPPAQSPLIQAEPGVFPEYRGVQGILKTHNGNVIIGPPSP